MGWRSSYVPRSKSIPVNIAEGMGKQESAADVRKFIRIAVGSCDETRVWLEFAKDLGYIEASEHERLDQGYREVGRMLRGLLRRYAARNDAGFYPVSSIQSLVSEPSINRSAIEARRDCVPFV
jgi:four helix bundle protein